MTEERDDCILGDEVTTIARSVKELGTTIVSVRIPNEELARLEEIAVLTDKTIAQVIRDAVEAYGPANAATQPELTLGIA